MIKKILGIVIIIIVLFIILLPIFVYYNALSYIDNYPQKVSSSITETDFEKKWELYEPNIDIDEFHKLTPYWMYKWLMGGILSCSNENINEFPFTDMSIMASKIAIYHMRETNVVENTKVSATWHVVHMNLSIWIQRNWNKKEILSYYENIVLNH